MQCSLAAELIFNRFVLRDDLYPRQYRNGSYSPVHEPLTLEVIDEHLRGEQCIGVYQLKGSKIKWVCWDVDGANEDPENARDAVLALIKTARHFGLTVYAERSGGKGWHLWLFTDTIEASLGRTIGLGILRETPEEHLNGTSEVAVFPKQVAVSDKGFGNLVKLPWGRRADNRQPGMFVDPDTLEVLSADPAVILAEVHEHSEADLTALVEENQWNIEARTFPKVDKLAGLLTRNYGGELPCYEYLVDVDGKAHIPAGGRNNLLFAFASQKKRSGSNERVALHDILGINREKCRPPLDECEVRKIVQSCYKSDESSAFCDVIQKANLCPVLIDGVNCPIFRKTLAKREEKRAALNTDESRLTIQPLRVMRTDPPIYTATVKGDQLQLTAQQLANFRLFKFRCMEVLDFIPTLPFVPTKDDPKKSYAAQIVWEMMVNEALAAAIEEPLPPEEASPRGYVWSVVKAFLTEGTVYEDRDNVAIGRIVLSDVGGQDYYLFRGEGLCHALKLRRIDELPLSQVWKLLHDHGGLNRTVKTPTKGEQRVWMIPRSAVDDREQETPQFNEPPRGLLE